MQLKYADVCKSTKKSENSNQNLTHSICLQETNGKCKNCLIFFVKMLTIVFRSK